MTEKDSLQTRRIGCLSFILAVVVLVGGTAAYLSWLDRRPPLVAGLPPDLQSMKLAFRDRIHTTFPIGTSEKVMVRELENEGFSHQTNSTAAIFEAFNLACRITWSMNWRAVGDVLQDIDTSVGTVCF